MVALPAGGLVLTAGPAAAHQRHAAAAAAAGTPTWLLVLVAVVGGLLVAARRRDPLALAVGAALLVLPSWRTGGLLTAGHVAGAGLWAGASLQVLRRPSRDALRAAAVPAVGGAVLASATGLASAWRLDVDLASSYGSLLLAKGAAVAVVLLLAAAAVRRPALVRVEALGLAVVVLLGTLLATRPLLDLPDGTTTTGEASLLVARDADGRRLLRVVPGDRRVDGVDLRPAIDGSATALLPAGVDRLDVDGIRVDLPAAVPLAQGGGDDAERLARTLATVLSGRAPAASDAVQAVRADLAAARSRGLQRPTVLVDDDPRGRALAAALGLPTGIAGADLVYVATSWGGAAAALAAVRQANPVGGAVLVPWLVAAQTADAARAGGLVLLADVALDGQAQLAYRAALSRLPGERPSLVGLSAWARPDRTASYAAAPAGILPALLDHASHDDGRRLPPWVASGGLTAVRSHVLGGPP